MIGFYVTAISRNEKQIKAFALRFTGADWAVAMYAKFVQCLTFDAVAAFDLFNLRLQSAVTPGGMLVVDESMWDWQSGSATVVFIPRKPTDQGVKVQTGCLSLTRTNEPYCYYMKPDISVTKMGPEAVLSDVITLMRRDGLRTLVVDCWYFSRGVLESYHDIAITVACGSDDMPNMAAIATSGLRRNQYRIFACGPLVTSVFADVADFRVLSTAFTYTASPSNVVIARTGMNTSSLPTIGEILHTTPLISESGFQILCGLSSADANSLARRLGVSTGTPSHIEQLVPLTES
jgi:hypothetical protein